MTIVEEPIAAVVGVAQPSHERLAPGVLSTVDIVAASLANMAPAMSFFFSFGAIAAFAGVAAPLTVIAAAIAIALLGNTLSQFVRAHPSAGSFVTFIGKGFGGYTAVVSAVVTVVGYTIATTGVVAISGGWTEIIIKHYLGVSIPWQLLTLLLTGGSAMVIISGAKPSTKAAAAFFGFEVILLVVISVVVLVQHSSHINLQPFNPGKLHGGLSGLSLGFPLAVFMFIGWENSASMAEESANPRKAVPRAVYASIALITAIYVLLSFATVVGFDQNIAKLTGTSVPFIGAAQGVSGLLVFFAYIAGFSSILSSLLAAVNSQARILFSSGREGLLPRVTGKVTKKSRTPWVAFIVILGFALGITYVFGWQRDPNTTVVFFGEVATLGTILVALVYLVTNLALPVYIMRSGVAPLSPLKHVILPLAGAAAIGYPLYELVKSGQAKPYSTYPLISLAVVVVALAYGAFAYLRDPTLSERVGSIVADIE